MSILKSASKLVFLLMTMAVIIFTGMRIIEPKDFITLATMAFTFYFANKGSEQNEFLGK